MHVRKDKLNVGRITLGFFQIEERKGGTRKEKQQNDDRIFGKDASYSVYVERRRGSEKNKVTVFRNACATFFQRSTRAKIRVFVCGRFPREASQRDNGFRKFHRPRASDVSLSRGIKLLYRGKISGNFYNRFLFLRIHRLQLRPQSVSCLSPHRA